MSTYAAFKRDEKLEQGGVILDCGTAGKFRIARAGGSNVKFNKRMATLTAPHRNSIRSEIIDPKVIDSIYVEAFVDTIILGWEDVTDENENPLPFNKENAKKLLNDLPELFTDIKTAAGDKQLFRLDSLDIAAKN